MAGYDDAPVASFDFHHSMLIDDVRVESFLKAILATVKPGDVVVDIGTGTGVLALFSALAGASHVYAIEQEPIIEVAEEIIGRNGYADRVTFMEGSSLDVELPRRGDVLVTETIGNAGFDEGITRWSRDAVERLLVPGAPIVPGRLDLVASLIVVPRDYEQIERWSRPLLTLDMSPLQRIATNNLLWAELNPVHEATDRQTLISVDLADAPDVMVGSATLTARRDTVIHGIGIWFVSELAPGIVITNEPPNAVPSWEQGFLALSSPVELAGGASIDVYLRIEDDGAHWAWRVGETEGGSTARGELGTRARN